MTYDEFLQDLGVTDNDVNIDMNTNCIIDTTVHCDGLCIAESSIHGIGVFAAKDFAIGDLIEWVGLRSDEDKAVKFMIGRYANHSDDPNIRFDFIEDGRLILAYAMTDIKAGDELTVDYHVNLKAIREIDELLIQRPDIDPSEISKLRANAA